MQVASLVLDMPPYIVANYKETQIGNIRAGQPVEILIDTFPGHTFKGHVESISPATGATFSLLPKDTSSGNFTKVVQRIPVRIAFEPGQERLPEIRSGMSVITRIDTGSDQTGACAGNEPRAVRDASAKKRLASSAPPRRGRPLAARLRVLPSFPLFPAPPLCRPTVRRALADRDVRDSSMPLCHLKDARRPEKKPPSRAGKRAVASDRLRQD